MGTSEPLGNLTHLRIWHDNSGPKGSQSWYLNRVVVDDLHTQERYLFMVCKVNDAINKHLYLKK